MMASNFASEFVRVLEHPLVAHNMVRLRDRETPAPIFRRALKEVGMLLAVEALVGAETSVVEVETPLARCEGRILARPVVLVPILRAGLGFAEGMMHILPDALLGHIGMARDEATHRPRHYYFRLPPGIENAEVLLVDPMLATGNSAAEALTALKSHGASRLRYVGLVGCPEGVRRVHSEHPDVPIFLAALDAGLNEKAYIVPGLGDAGDRYFGTQEEG